MTTLVVLLALALAFSVASLAFNVFRIWPELKPSLVRLPSFGLPEHWSVKRANGAPTCAFCGSAMAQLLYAREVRLPSGPRRLIPTLAGYACPECGLASKSRDSQAAEYETVAEFCGRAP